MLLSIKQLHLLNERLAGGQTLQVGDRRKVIITVLILARDVLKALYYAK
jgi:hypothetical protein